MKYIVMIPKIVVYLLFRLITFICSLGVMPVMFYLAGKKMREDPTLKTRNDDLVRIIYDELDPIFFLSFFDNTIIKLEIWCFGKSKLEERLQR